MIYIIGSLRNPDVRQVAKRLKQSGHDVFVEWLAAGEVADDAWRDHFKEMGLTFPEALETDFVKHAFKFDYDHLVKADTVVLVLPAGKSGHLELGWALGQGKKGYILLDNTVDRWDLMYRFATKVVTSVEELLAELVEKPNWSDPPLNKLARRMLEEM